MEKIKKDYKSKFVSLILTAMFIFNSTAYGVTLSNSRYAESRLRVPVKIDPDRAKRVYNGLRNFSVDSAQPKAVVPDSITFEIAQLIANPNSENLADFGVGSYLGDITQLEPLLKALEELDESLLDTLLYNLESNPIMNQKRSYALYKLLQDIDNLRNKPIWLSYQICFLGKSLNMGFLLVPRVKTNAVVMVAILHDLEELASTLGRVASTAFGSIGTIVVDTPDDPRSSYADLNAIFVNMPKGYLQEAKLFFDDQKIEPLVPLTSLAHEIAHKLSWLTDMRGRHFIPFGIWEKIAQVGGFGYVIKIEEGNELIPAHEFLSQQFNGEYDDFEIPTALNLRWAAREGDELIMYIEKEDKQRLKEKGDIVEKGGKFYFVANQGSNQRKIRIEDDVNGYTHFFSSPQEMVAIVTAFAVHYAWIESDTLRAIIIANRKPTGESAWSEEYEELLKSVYRLVKLSFNPQQSYPIYLPSVRIPRRCI